MSGSLVGWLWLEENSHLIYTRCAYRHKARLNWTMNQARSEYIKQCGYRQNIYIKYA